MPLHGNGRFYKRKRVFGSEQEYGILVKCARGNRLCSELGCWNIFRQSFYPNGSFLTVDCQHPEYASPEASNPLDAVIYDKAGELLVQRKVLGSNVKLFKNNRGLSSNELLREASFASHENYSLGRVEIENLVIPILPFLISRIIFTGGGFVGLNGEYEISQKAGVTKWVICEGTTENNKAIFNTRDEPLTNCEEFTRLHVVSGDANLSETALFLKYGTMGLVLDLFEDGELENMFKIKDKRLNKVLEDEEQEEKSDDEELLDDEELELKGRLERMFILEDEVEVFHSISGDLSVKKKI